MNYTDLQTALTILAEQAQSPYTSLPIDFSTMIPRFIEYAEGRIYKKMGFLGARAQNSSLKFTANSRSLDLSGMTGNIILLPEGLAMIYPAATTNPALGNRIGFEMASLDTIDMVWPQESVTVDPSTVDFHYWALKDDHTIVVAPTPDQTYTAEVTGLFQPAAISASNQTTYLSANYPGLLLAGCMIAVAGYLRDYGQQSDDPKLAQSWEQQYQGQEKIAYDEEQRRRGQGEGWNPSTPTTLAKPPRTG